MALVDNAWYVNYGDGSTTGYYAVAMWTALTTYNCGNVIRQRTAPAVGSERCFVAIVGAVASLASEPSFTLTRGAKTAEAASVTWQECTGIAALNGDLTNTPSWTTVKNTAITLGQVIKNNAGTLVLICSAAGTAGNGAEPSWAAFTNAGATTADNTATWTTLGASFAAWAAPHARIASALTTTWVQAGNSVFVGDNHAETQATAITITGAGTLASPVLIYCCDKTIAPPTTSDLKTTATVTVTGAVAITWSGIYYVYGIASIAVGNGSNNASVIFSGSWIKLEACSIQTTTTAAANFLTVFSGSYLEMINTTVKFGNTGQTIRPSTARWIWKNTASAVLGSAPTTLIQFGGNLIATFMGVDFSALTSSSLFSGVAAVVQAQFINCKLPSGVTFGTPTGPASTTDIIVSDSTATNYIQQFYRYQGTLTNETTIVRTGGASDGTTPISWKIVTTANSKWLVPFESPPIAIWNTSPSAITTLTFYGTTTGGGVPKDDEIWVEVEYMGSTLTPQGSFVTSTKANNLAASAATNNNSDGSTWGGSGAGNGFKIVVPSFTPGMAGPLNITIKAAKVSSTYYIDPRPSISGVTANKSEILAPGVYANELSSGGGVSRARAFAGFA